MDFLNNINQYLKDQVSSVFSQNTDASSNEPTTRIIENMMSTFQLPIDYLEKDTVYPLSDIVNTDLELATNTEITRPCMYQHLFQPGHVFSNTLIQKWKKSYTINTSYLQDQQTVLSNMNKCADSNYVFNSEKIIQIWQNVKEDPHFLERYSYMEWECLKHLNDSSTFLQLLGLANIISPIISLLIPLIVFITPFIVLKLKGVHFSFGSYLDILKNVSSKSTIGKIIFNGGKNLNFINILYIFAYIGIYAYQSYQNIVTCQRFYRNISTINDSLYEVKEFSNYSMANMIKFVEINQDTCKTFDPFFQTTLKHRDVLIRLHDELQYISKFKPGLFKFTEIGNLLKCFYHLYDNKEYEGAIKYAIGFESYIDNLRGVFHSLQSGKIAFAQYENESDKCEFKDQYYPPHMENAVCVYNDCSFKKNMVITGPNASGKTTFLKTTLINIIFSQQIGCGFYKKATLKPYTHFHSYLNIPDTSERDSLFQAESRRCKDIIQHVQEFSDADKFRHFCVFDELYSGTNPKEASKSGYSFLLYLSNFKHVNFILTTHYMSICRKLKKSKTMENYRMKTTLNEAGKLKYHYLLEKGINKIEGAIHILEDMNYPKEIIDSVKQNTI